MHHYADQAHGGHHCCVAYRRRHELDYRDEDRMIRPISIATMGHVNGVSLSPLSLATDGYLNPLSIRTMIVGGRNYSAIRSDDEEVLEILQRIFGGLV